MRWRIKSVDTVTQGGGKLPTRYNITFEELDADRKVIGEYVVGSLSDVEEEVKNKISQFLKARAEAPPIRPPHGLEGKEYEG